MIKKIKGKEYIKGKLEYEGEYLCGKKWNGKVYNKKGDIAYIINNGFNKIKEDNKLIYEGEVINGKRNGKGKEYDYFYLGRSIFEGKFLNGKRWKGIIKEYHYNEKLKFEGEYLDGKINGIGKEYHYNGKLKFEGEYINGERNGKGKEYDERDGKVIFKGYYKNGNREDKSKKPDCKIF